MLRGMRPFLFLALALIGSHTAPAAASNPPRCTPAREGEVACIDGKLCECRHDPGGALSGRRAGTRWNCGALRPACGGTMPADIGTPAAERMPPPPSLFPAPYGAQPGWR